MVVETAASNPDKCRFGLVGVKRDARGEIEQALPGWRLPETDPRNLEIADEPLHHASYGSLISS